jgi:pyrroline-5-carboxylate reductase
VPTGEAAATIDASFTTARCTAMSLSTPPTPAHSSTTADNGPAIAFIGGGNMASAIIGGLIRQGMSPTQMDVVEPWEDARTALQRQYDLTAQALPSAQLARAGLVVWAVKPQTFKDAAAQVRPFTPNALHLSVAAGIRSSSLVDWLGSERIVRAMPNTPALIGQGMTALYARPGISAAERQQVEQVLAPTGQLLWVEDEVQLDAVTALSGSGPAYVFYFLEAMTQAGVAMGLSAAQAHQLAVGTFAGASELARRSDELPAVLRQRVTSKGGTTYAALQSMEASHVSELVQTALHAAQQRARELGDAFGA